MKELEQQADRARHGGVPVLAVLIAAVYGAAGVAFYFYSGRAEGFVSPRLGFLLVALTSVPLGFYMLIALIFGFRWPRSEPGVQSCSAPPCGTPACTGPRTPAKSANGSQAQERHPQAAAATPSTALALTETGLLMEAATGRSSTSTRCWRRSRSCGRDRSPSER